MSRVPKVLAGDRPDVTAVQAASGGIVAAAGLAGYAAGMRGVDFYVFLGCATVFACVATFCDAKLRGARNAATVTTTLYESGEDFLASLEGEGGDDE